MRKKQINKKKKKPHSHHTCWQSTWMDWKFAQHQNNFNFIWNSVWLECWVASNSGKPECLVIKTIQLFIFRPSIHSRHHLSLFRITGAGGAYLSCLGAKGRRHPELVAGQSQDTRQKRQPFWIPFTASLSGDSTHAWSQENVPRHHHWLQGNVLLQISSLQ